MNDIHLEAEQIFVEKRAPGDIVVALAGNPNVGKSTVFNALTGLKQHTGNWPGKTVSIAQGYCKTEEHQYVLVDIPGTYSLMAHSAEEEVARNFLCFGGADAVVVVCDATCLERNLNLVLQTIELCPNVIVCVNLLDEAKRKGISVDLTLLEARLGVPVVGAVAQKKKRLAALLHMLDSVHDRKTTAAPFTVRYEPHIERAIAKLLPLLAPYCSKSLPARWLALHLLDCDKALKKALDTYLGTAFSADEALRLAVIQAQYDLLQDGIDRDRLKDLVVSALVRAAESICGDVVHCRSRGYDRHDRHLDRILTSRLTGYPVMLALLALIFWLTISGANYPSALLSRWLFHAQDWLGSALIALRAPEILRALLIDGVYRTLAWVVSVMLPPMAIFFPLFTLLEDAGYLPRIAYNLDKTFKRCNACGKQALTMCMGFGCNAVGVTGCRIIDSPRERLLAILTNSLVPCNGRFPTLIALLTMFFAGAAGGMGASLRAALLLTLVLLLGILMTFAATKLLSVTILKGLPSSFTLELPPYRKPQLGKVVVRSLLDRTLFVLGRAASVAAPAGLIIWIAANVHIGDASILTHCADFLDPFARLMGLDGVILIAFILGFPANEIVMPIIVMAYLAKGSLLELASLAETRALLIANGWTWMTAASVILFSLFHWPCSTTLLTVKKETGSTKWTLLAAALPSAIGILLCMLFTAAVRLF